MLNLTTHKQSTSQGPNYFVCYSRHIQPGKQRRHLASAACCAQDENALASKDSIECGFVCLFVSRIRWHQSADEQDLFYFKVVVPTFY